MDDLGPRRRGCSREVQVKEEFGVVVPAQAGLFRAPAAQARQVLGRPAQAGCSGAATQGGDGQRVCVVPPTSQWRCAT
jgi:hypothetical protein